MPNCIQLIRKDTNEPATFQDIDNEMCAHFGVTPHPTQYYMGWYSSIGMSLAMGATFDRLIIENEEYMQEIYEHHLSRRQSSGEYEEDIAPYRKRHDILVWLMNNFKVNAWCERR